MKPHRARQGMKILMLLFLLSLTVPVRAQLGNEGSIEGIVTDPSGAVVPGVSLKARNADTSATFSATSDASGLFRFLVLPVGTYELVADHSGFATLVQKNVVVAIGAKISLTLSLKLATGTETVVVKSETPLLESTRSQVSTTAYSAELGRAGAGVVSVITKSGTNEIHGSLFWYFRDRALNATSLISKNLGQVKEPFHVHQFGGAVGGPIRKN